MTVVTKEVQKLLSTAVLAAGMVIASVSPSTALHNNTVGSIDVIDGIFGPAGGMINEFLTANGTPGQGESDWFVFTASSGDTVQIRTEGPTDTILGIFFDLDDMMQVGDDPKCANTILFDCQLVGQDPGFDLEFVAFSDDDGMGSNALVDLTVMTTGTYVFVVQEFSKNDEGPYTAFVEFDTLPGNGSGPGTPSVSEPGTLAILGLGLAGLGFARRRRTA